MSEGAEEQVETMAEPPALLAAIAAFEVGNHAEVRRRLHELEPETAPEVVHAREDLARRIRPDAVEALFLLGCFLFFAAIVWKYVL